MFRARASGVLEILIMSRLVEGPPPRDAVGDEPALTTRKSLCGSGWKFSGDVGGCGEVTQGHQYLSQGRK